MRKPQVHNSMPLLAPLFPPVMTMSATARQTKPHRQHDHLTLNVEVGREALVVQHSQEETGKTFIKVQSLLFAFFLLFLDANAACRLQMYSEKVIMWCLKIFIFQDANEHKPSELASKIMCWWDGGIWKVCKNAIQQRRSQYFQLAVWKYMLSQAADPWGNHSWRIYSQFLGPATQIVHPTAKQ